MTDERDANHLARRVDELIRRQLEDSQRAVEEVPVLTDVLERERRAGGAAPALAEDLERALLGRLLPELNRQIAGMRGELEKELRRAVREAVTATLAAPVRAPDAD